MTMTADEYQQAALRTEYTPDFALALTVAAIETGLQTRAISSTLSRIMHGMIGICTEAGELQDMIKKHLIYGKPFDPVNVMEECGDVLWYIGLCLDAVGYTLPEAMERNIEKLRKRFPDKFTNEHALTRDLDAERKALEARPGLVLREDAQIAALQRMIQRHEATIADLHAKAVDHDIAARYWNVAITDLHPVRDADHALEALRRVAHQFGIDSPIKVRDPSNRRIAEMCCARLSELRALFREHTLRSSDMPARLRAVAADVTFAESNRVAAVLMNQAAREIVDLREKLAAFSAASL